MSQEDRNKHAGAHDQHDAPDNLRHEPEHTEPTGETAHDTPESEQAMPQTPEEQLEAVRSERDEALDKWKRALADFQNYQRRAVANEREARQQGVRTVVHSILSAMDHFDMALGQDPQSASAEQILNGVRVIRDELMRALETHGVGVIEPQPDESFDANRHEAMMHQQDESVTPGHVIRTLQIGYTLDDRVIRPAKVAVARGQEGDNLAGAPGGHNDDHNQQRNNDG